MDDYTGLCVGGPLNGKILTSRFNKGVLVVDRPTNSAWVYDNAGEVFISRSDDPMELIEDEVAPMNRWRAATEFSYEVIALPGIDSFEDGEKK